MASKKGGSPKPNRVGILIAIVIAAALALGTLAIGGAVLVTRLLVNKADPPVVEASQSSPAQSNKEAYALYAQGLRQLNSARSLEAVKHTQIGFTTTGESLTQSKYYNFTFTSTADGNVELKGHMKSNDALSEKRTEGDFWFKDGFMFYAPTAAGTPSKMALSASEMMRSVNAGPTFGAQDVISSEQQQDSGGVQVHLIIRGSVVEAQIRESMGAAAAEVDSVSGGDMEIYAYLDKEGTLNSVEFTAAGTITMQGQALAIASSGDYEVHSVNKVTAIDFPEEIYSFPEQY